MPDVPTPKAARLQKPSWRDTRLLVGVLLVLAATVLGSATWPRPTTASRCMPRTARCCPASR